MRRPVKYPLLSALLFLFSICADASDIGHEIRVGVYENSPLISIGASDRVDGLFIDIIRHVASSEGWSLRFIPGNWEENIGRLESGEIDVLPAIAVTDQRKQEFLFIEQSIISNWGQIFVASGSSIKAMPDLDNKKIAVLKGDVYVTSDDGIRALCGEFSLRCTFKEMSSYIEVLRAVDSGEVDAGLVNRLFGMANIDNINAVPSAIIMMPLDIRMAISKSSEHAAVIQEKIDNHLVKLKRDKTSIYYRAFASLKTSSTVIEKVPLWVVLAIGVIVNVLAVLLAGNYFLRWKVKARTKALSLSEMRYRELFESASISLWEEDLSGIYRELQRLRDDGVRDLADYLRDNPSELERFSKLVRVIDVNPATLNMLSAPSREALLEGLHVVFCDSSFVVFEKGLIAIWEGRQSFTAEAEHRTFAGEVIQVLVSHPIPQNLEESERVPVIVLDITESKKTRQVLLEREAQLRTLIDALPDLVWLKDTAGVYLNCNPKFERFFGAKEADIVGKTDYDFVPKELADFFRDNDRAAISAGKPSMNEEEIIYADDGHREVLETIKTPMYAADGGIIGVLGVGRDITLRKEQELRILHQAHFDALTELPNRFLSLDRLAQLLKDAQRNNESVAVLFLDLDDFKKINDTLGHETGDKLLIEAAGRLRAAVREGDTVGRLGGDEFIVLLGGIANASAVRPVVENLLERFRDSFKVDGRELIITASVGISIYPDDGDSPSELLRSADSAMYHSKGQGRNTYSYYTDAMNKDVARRLALEEQMHGALGRGEFRLCYQPQLEIDSGTMVGIEALLRWHNPLLGDVQPGEFIPIAEHTGMIVPIGRFVINEALGTLAQLQQRNGSALRIAVNFSPRQFRDPSLVSFITDALQDTELSGEALELEITEGVLMGAHGFIDEILNKLAGMGVNLAMDDFGTGYSSLSYLRSYPFDVIKIDRSFVNDIAVDPADRELISATVAMAHGLGLKVVAEGVENEGQLEYLTELGCDYAQGYLFSKPVSKEHILRMPRNLWNQQLAANN